MKTWPWVIAVALLVLAIGCSDDNKVVEDCFSCKCDPAYCPQKGQVLVDLERALNRRDGARYDAVLDDNYTFIFDTVQHDSLVAGQWGRDDDIAATTSMFSGVVSLAFDLDNSDGLTWTVTPAPGGLENWYTTTVFYHFTIKIGDTTYIPRAESKMSLTVRNAGTSEALKWKLVELRDLGGESPLNATRSQATELEVTTYGEIKARFNK